MTFDYLADPWFYAVAVPAVILTGFSKAGLGGGIGSLSVPLMSLLIAPSQALAIMLPILLLLDMMGLWTFRARIDARILRTAVPAALLGIGVGWFMFSRLDANWIRALIGLEAVLFALQKLFEGRAAWTGEPAPWQPGRARFWSAVSGFTSFISHAGSPPMMQFMLPLKLHREIFVGTMAWHFAAINFSKILPYAQLGLLDLSNLSTSLLLVPAVPLGYWLGLRMLQRISAGVFVRLAIIGLLLTGCKLLWDAGSALFAS
jgi:uncharacterized membrane protein YfcA